MSLPSENDGFSAKPWLCFMVAATGTFMATLDGGIVNITLPTVASEFGVGVGDTQWVLSAYLLAISCTLPMAGRLGDLRGQRTMYSLGFVVFTLGSMLCGLAQSLWMLAASRIIQGLGSSLLMANGPAIVMLSFPGPTKGRALGFVGLTVALGSLFGPALGGFLMHAYGWRSVYYVSVPVGVFGLIAALAILPKQDRRPAPMDWIGLCYHALTMIGFTSAMTGGQHRGWFTLPTLGLFTICFSALFSFLRRERQITSPLINLTLFDSKPFAIGSLTALLSFAALFCNAVLLPFSLRGPYGLSEWASGLVMAVMPATMALVAPFAGRLSERLSHARMTSGGLLAMGLGLFGQALAGDGLFLWAVVANQMLIGLGLGLFIPTNANSVMSSAPKSQAGVAGGVMALTRNIGMVVGVVTASAVYETVRASSGLSAATQWSVDGFKAALSLGAVFCLFSAVVSLRRGEVRHKVKKARTSA